MKPESATKGRYARCEESVVFARPITKEWRLAISLLGSPLGRGEEDQEQQVFGDVAEAVLDARGDRQQRAGLGREVLVAHAEAGAALHHEVDLLLAMRALLVLLAAAQAVEAAAQLRGAQHLEIGTARAQVRGGEAGEVGRAGPARAPRGPQALADPWWGRAR